MDDSQQPDVIDLILKLAIFVSFVVFGICMWVLRREMNKKKAANQKDVNK
jgi:hypothetical protein